MCASSQPDPSVVAAVLQKAQDASLTCAGAHGIAEMLKKDPVEVGDAMHSMGIRLRQCQLGLFGYCPQSSILTAAETVPENIQCAIASCVMQNRLSCRSCWQIAWDLNISKLTVARSAEALNIKISRCQLGVF